MKRYFKNGSTVLFQGDSVTDCDRSREDLTDLGPGYPGIFADLYGDLFPGYDVRFVNRGVSGDRVRNLLMRYDEDFAAVRPDYLFIEIGVNDTWRRYDSDDPCPVELFYAQYRELLTKIRSDLPDTEVILLTPYLLRTIPERYQWRFEDLDAKVEATKRLSGEFALKRLDLQDVLDRAVIYEGFKDAELTEDSVHPTKQGHAVIAAAIARFLEII